MMHTLFKCSPETYKVLGILIVQGNDIPPKLLAMPDHDQFQLLKADVTDPLVRQFVGQLVAGCSPVPEFTLVSSRQVHAGNSASY